MVQQLADILGTIQVDQPRTAGGLQVFGLRWNRHNGIAYSTLDEALAAGTLEVSEISDGGSVPVLKLINKSDRKAFLLAGEQLIGAKQNRVLNTSLLVGEHSELPIPVSCVEAGRWAYRSPKFGSSGTSSHSILRSKMSKHVSDGYRLCQAPVSKQDEVWSEVSRKLGAMGSASDSSALEQAYEDKGLRLGDILGQLPAPEGCHGAVFVFGGQVRGLDLFDQPATLGKLWPKLIRSYAIDALEAESAGPLDQAAVNHWLQTAAQARAEPFKSPGLGQDIRIEAKDLVGAGLMVDDQPVHVELFAAMSD